jgi:hypothetical protein
LTAKTRQKNGKPRVRMQSCREGLPRGPHPRTSSAPTRAVINRVRERGHATRGERAMRTRPRARQRSRPRSP